MKLSIALSALLVTGFVAAGTEKAGAVVDCQYVEYPAGCVVRPGVVVAPTHDDRKIPPSIAAPRRGFILRQTCSIEITRTTCDRIGTLRQLNRASSENYCVAIPAA